jgi:2,3-bisphosphoglycerate-independent phosphoglycerate mutase
MPLEIRELHIKVNVNQPQQASQESASGEGDDAEKKKDALINQCIEEVMDILKNKKER